METIRLLQTKLSIPPVRADLVPRPRLLQRLNEGLSGKLTMVSAPAGFGKTTLLAHWARGSSLPVTWLSLDESDNEPVRFMAYLTAALEKVCGGKESKEEPNANIQPTYKGPEAVGLHEARLTKKINQMAGKPSRFILILDDYHTISNQQNHKTITFLIENQPPQMHLVIASRADLPLPLARLRGRGQLNELRSADLRFNDEEAATFMQEVLSKDLSPEDVSALANKTEGWVAGLQMAALALQSPYLDQPQKLSGFIRDFTGTNRFILDYLVEEVLDRQAESIQDFLLKTSILERMSAPLCDEVVARLEGSDVQTFECSNEILEYLDRSNLFIVPLDDRREWYRYHRLFADLLRRRFQYAHSELVPTLHERASQWFEKNGYLEEAVEHAFRAKNAQRAADLIEKVAESMMMHSQVTTLRSWLDRLPEELIATRPALCVYHAWILYLNNQALEIIEARLALVDSKAEPIASMAAPLKAFIAAFEGSLRQASGFARQALEKLPEENYFLRGMAYLVLATGELSEGDPQAGIRALDQAAQISNQTGNILLSVLVLASLADNYRKLGQLHKMETLYRQALDLAVDSGGNRLPIAGRTLLGLGALMYEWNRLEDAECYIKEGIKLIKKWGTLPLYSAFINLARVKYAQGDASGATKIFERARQQAIQTEMTPLDDWVVDIAQAFFWISEEKYEQVERWVESRGLLKEIDKTNLSESQAYAYAHVRKYEQIILARLRLAQGRIGEALELLEALFPQVEKIGRVGLMIEILALKAIAFYKQGKRQAALSVLDKALSLAEPEGYIRVFLNEGEPMRELISAAAQSNIQPAYTGKLLENFMPERGLSVSHPYDDQSLNTLLETVRIDPLSAREMEVLFLLRSRLTVPEIAEELCIADSTVRSHVKSIYSKLSVHRRMDAVQRAEELGMLPKMPQ
ncbi:MAG: tetratricopeptide repeat protein [Anaerolineales bacterium]